MLVESLMEQLRLRGYRLTEQRKHILTYFLQHDRYVSAREIIDYLKAFYPTMSFETVYRNVRTMVEEGFLEESKFEDNETKYRIACQTTHHHHFICVSCGKTAVIAHCPMPDIGTTPEGFTVLQHRFEVLGYCGGCQPIEDDARIAQ